MPILTCCCANAGTAVATSAKRTRRLRSTIQLTCSARIQGRAADYSSRSPSRGGRQKIFAQPLAPRHGRAQIEAVDDGKAKPAGRHGVAFRRAVFVEGDLHAGDARHGFDLVDQRRRRMAVARPVRSEQHDAVAFAAIVVEKIPLAPLVEPDHGVDPARAIEIGPLVGKTQMRLDNGFADGFEIEHAGIAGKILPHPFTAPRLDCGVRLGMHDPVVEGALAGRLAGDMPPPARLAVDHGDVGGDMSAVQQRHPEMTGRVVPDVIGFRSEHPAADAHALEIDDRLGKDRVARRRHAVRSGIEILAQRQRKLVVDEAMRRVPLPSVAILRRNIGGGVDMREILQAPRIGFADRHVQATEL